MRVTRISEEVWEIPQSEKEGMLVPARIYATPAILQSMDVGVFEQVTNVACLPGIRRYALCMPDGHGAMVSPSEVSPRLMSGQESFRLGVSAMTSIAACASSGQISSGKM